MDRIGGGVRVLDRFADEDPEVEIEVAEVFSGGARLGCYRVAGGGEALEYREYPLSDLMARERRRRAPLLDPSDLGRMTPLGWC